MHPRKVNQILSMPGLKRKAHVEVKLSSPCLEVLFASLAATFVFWMSFLFGGPHTFGRTLRVRSFSRQLLLQACCLSQVADWVADCFAWWFWQPSMSRLRLTLTCRGGWQPRLSSDFGLSRLGDRIESSGSSDATSFSGCPCSIDFLADPVTKRME